MWGCGFIECRLLDRRCLVGLSSRGAISNFGIDLGVVNCVVTDRARAHFRPTAAVCDVSVAPPGILLTAGQFSHGYAS
jgi:hypothetical protein